jgi:thymidylate synthase (FAD)
MQTAKIEAYTQVDPTSDNPDIRSMTSEEFLVYVARVSNPDNQFNHLTGPKLLRHCAKNAHWSVFDMVDVVIKVETTRDIGRQLLRHWSFRFQEFSQRYADPTQAMGFTLREARLQDTKNRQNSIDVDDRRLSNWFENIQQGVIDKAKQVYSVGLGFGLAKEQLRTILPEGLTMSTLYVKGSLRSWITYCGLRRKNGTQKEHMELAELCWAEIIRVFPGMVVFDEPDEEIQRILEIIDDALNNPDNGAGSEEAALLNIRDYLEKKL